MQNQNKIKEIMERHISAMFDEISGEGISMGWLGENASNMLAEVMFNTIAFSNDAQKYLEEQNILKVGG